jgi:uncharacterized protein (TIGR00255 family)
MNSMTGHGRGTASVRGVRAVVECSSVNRRQAEVVFSAPRDLACLEARVRDRALARVSRGRLVVNVAVELPAGGAGVLDPARARAYLAELRALQRTLGIPGAVPLETVLAGPGVVRSGGPAADPWPAVAKALDAALEDLLAMRAAEGANLRRPITRDAKALGALPRKVRPHAAKLPARHRAALLERLDRARLPITPADPRLAAEIVLFAERCDISEELDRLGSHASQLAEKLAGTGPVGRTLEFLLQEIAREWNTIGAKSPDTTVSRFVVEAKTLIDRLREQLANIE